MNESTTPRKFRRRPLLLAGLLTPLLGRFGSILPASAQEKTTVTYFTFSAAPDHLTDLQKMVDAFQTANPTISVKVETAAYADYFTALQTRVAGGAAPDVFELNFENFISYASKGVLQDLTAFASADPTITSRYYPKAYQAFTYKGVQYGLPESFSDVVLFYNKDLFDKAGLAYPTSAWTWKEEAAAAKKLTNKAAGVWGEYSPISFFELYKTAAQNGGSFFGADGSVTINDPKCVEALQYLLDAQTNGWQPTDAELAGVANEDIFKQGQIAMLTTGIWLFDSIAKSNVKWDIVVEPGNTQKANHFFANAVVVSKDSKHQDAAWKWSSFLTSDPAAARIRVAASWELPALQDQSLFDSYLAKTPPANRAAVFEALQNPVTPPVIAQQQKMQDAVGALLDKVKAGDMTPQQALDEAKIEIEALIKP